MTACSLINFAINPELLKGEIDSIIKSDRPNKYLNITKSIYRKLWYRDKAVTCSTNWVKVWASLHDIIASNLASRSLVQTDTASQVNGYLLSTFLGSVKACRVVHCIFPHMMLKEKKCFWLKSEIEDGDWWERQWKGECIQRLEPCKQAPRLGSLAMKPVFMSHLVIEHLQYMPNKNFLCVFFFFLRLWVFIATTIIHYYLLSHIGRTCGVQGLEHLYTFLFLFFLRSEGCHSLPLFTLEMVKIVSFR